MPPPTCRRPRVIFSSLPPFNQILALSLVTVLQFPLHTLATPLFPHTPILFFSIMFLFHLLLLRISCLFVLLVTYDNPITIEFNNLGFSVKDRRTTREIMRCNSDGDLYPFHTSPHSTMQCVLTATTDIWHQRLGHPGRDSFHRLAKNFEFTCNKDMLRTCHVCRLGKHVRLPFHDSTSTTSSPFELIHCDVWTSPVS